jgi:hypothetical protein
MVSKGLDKQFSSANTQVSKVQSSAKNLALELTKVGNQAALKELFAGTQPPEFKPVNTDVNAFKQITKQFEEQANIIPNTVKQLTGYGKQLNEIEGFYGKASPEAKKYFDTIVKGGKASAAELKKAQKITGQFSFDFLSLIFGGQAIQRIFGGAFKTLKEEYTKLTDDTDAFVKKTNNLSAAFTFLKYSIFSAFADSPFVQNAIEGFTNTIQGLADFVNNHPKLAAGITGIMGALGLIGAGITGAGIWKQLFMAQGGTLSVFGGFVAGVGKLATYNLLNIGTGIGKFFSGFTGTGANPSKIRDLADSIGVFNKEAARKFTAIDAAVGLAVVINTVQILSKDGTSFGKKALTVAGLSYIGARIGAAIAGPVGAAIGGVIGASAGIVISITDTVIEKKSENDALKEIADFANISATTYVEEFDKALADNPISQASAGGILYSNLKINKEVAKSNAQVLEESLVPFTTNLNSLKDEYRELTGINMNPDDAGYKEYISQLTDLQSRINTLTILGEQYLGPDFTTAILANDRYKQSLSESIINPLNDVDSEVSDLQDKLSNFEIISGVEAFKDLDVESFKESLEAVKGPLSEFLNEFIGKEGLIDSISSLISETTSYVNVTVPALSSAIDIEIGKVDSLTKSYKDLAKAKRDVNIEVEKSSGYNFIQPTSELSVYGK